jgi:hypothetical protein
VSKGKVKMETVKFAGQSLRLVSIDLVDVLEVLITISCVLTIVFLFAGVWFQSFAIELLGASFNASFWMLYLFRYLHNQEGVYRVSHKVFQVGNNCFILKVKV